jgi:hypothetical protein
MPEPCPSVSDAVPPVRLAMLKAEVAGRLIGRSAAAAAAAADVTPAALLATLVPPPLPAAAPALHQ